MFAIVFLIVNAVKNVSIWSQHNSNLQCNSRAILKTRLNPMSNP